MRFGMWMMVGILVTQSGCGFISRMTGNDVASNRAKWQTSGVADYKMRISIQKPGHGTPMGTYVIRVRAGQVESIHGAGPPVPRGGEVKRGPETLITHELFLGRFGPYDTIDEYFGIIENAGTLSHKLETEYDPELGYPKFLHLDPRANAIDDELMVQVIELEKSQ